MTQWVPLTKACHQMSGWQRPRHYGHAAKDSVVPVIMSELPHLVASTPLAFMRKPSGQYQLMAVQSVSSGVNLFVHPGHKGWLRGHIPAPYRLYPFRLLPEAGSGRLILCIDAHYRGLHAQCWDDDEPLLDDHGQAVDLVYDIAGVLQQYRRERYYTDVAVQALVDAQMIKPWRIEVRDGPDAASGAFWSGLYRIDETALRQSDSATLKRLNQLGALGIAHSQLLAQHRLATLRELYQIHHDYVPEPDIDFDNLFSDGEALFRFS
ncbi:SapC family protein [Terasakiispira papahanaumokuakeensis]|nr:SapC family protein [Terasakiispira papahanaumokuakeensis]